MEREILELAEKLRNVEGILAVYLFGSYADGKVHDGSDIDICVIGRLGRKDKERILCIVESDKYDLSFFSDLPIWIKIRVFRGRLLFARNKERVYEIYFRTLREYLDFKPAIKRLCEETLCTT